MILFFNIVINQFTLILGDSKIDYCDHKIYYNVCLYEGDNTCGCGVLLNIKNNISYC